MNTMPDRDPRRNPKPGDVLSDRNGNARRVLKYYPGSNVEFGLILGRTLNARAVTIRSWRRWAKDAEVLSRA